jgi:hypothetical protein
MVRAAFPGSGVVSIHPFPGGMRNANFKLKLSTEPSPVMLRMYEHDASLCQKEVDLIRLIGSSVPVAEVLYAEPHGWDDAQPFAFFRFIEGASFRELKRRGEVESTAQAAQAVGEIVACFSQSNLRGQDGLRLDQASPRRSSKALILFPDLWTCVSRRRTCSGVYPCICGIASAPYCGRGRIDWRSHSRPLVWFTAT